MAIAPIILKMGVMVTLMLTGFFCTKIGLTGPEFNRRVNPVVINVFLVATILDAVIGATERVSGAVLAEYFGLHVLMFVISMLVAEAAVRIIRVPKESRGVLWCLTAFMNNAFIGFPLAAAIYGEQAVFYAAISNIPFNLLLYTIGMAKLRQGDGEKLLAEFGLTGKHCHIINGHIPVKVKKGESPIKGGGKIDTVDTMAGATIPVSMMIIGTSLGSVSVGKVFTNPKVYAAVFVRLIAVPVAVWAVLRLIAPEPMMLGIPVLMSACPSAMIITVFCLQYGKDDLFSSQVIFMSTLLSAVSIPALFAVLF